MELWQWIITTIVSTVAAFIAIVGALIARDRALTAMVNNGDDGIRKEFKAATDALHERVNRTRDEMSEKYVRRADLDAHMNRIESSIRDVREDLKDNTQQLTQVLTHLRRNVVSGE